MDLSPDVLDAIRDAIKQSAQLALAVGADLSSDLVKDKAKKDPVTVGDWGCQALICRTLQDKLPDIVVIGEENLDILGTPENQDTLETVTSYVRRFVDADATKVASWIQHGGHREAASSYWTLDPIDGTKGFVRGQQFSVLLALVVEGQVELGIAACPRLDDTGFLFMAQRGKGATVEALDGTSGPKPIAVSDLADSTQAVYAESVESWADRGGHAEIAERLGITKDPVRLDSAAKYAMAARGTADLYFRMHTNRNYDHKVWDHAVGNLLVAEAGGKVTDFDGKPLDFSKPPYLTQHRGILASNGHLHEQTLRVIEDMGIARW